MVKAEINRLIQHLQWVVLMIHVFIIALGGCTFGMAIASRPILRLTRPENFHQVKSICDLMVGTGLLQIFIAGLDIFAACWKLFKPLYLALALASTMLILDIVAVSTCSWICIESHLIVTEDILYTPWYEWDCLPHGSCKMGMIYYIERFVVPQIGLAVISGVLQVFGIVYLIKLIRTLQDKQHQIVRARELKLRGSEANNSKAVLKEPEDAKKKEESDDEWFGASGEEKSDEEEKQLGEKLKSPASPTFDLEGQTYVQASGASLDNDYDDVNVMRHRGKNVKEPQSLTFNGSVEVHVFNPNGGDAEGNDEDTTIMTTKM